MIKAVVADHPIPAASLKAIVAGTCPLAPETPVVEPLVCAGGPTAVELAEARDENELLLLQLHQAQEELEDVHRRFGLASATNETAAVAQGSANLLDMHDQGAHRHLDFTIKLVSEADAIAPKLRVRLVDHLGRPGLAMLAKHSGEVPLSSWQPTGRENKREFMLLVPTDEQGRGLLQRLGGADWQRVNDVAHVIRRHVCSDGWMLGSHWQATAARLCRQFADLPARWRYDELAVTRVDDGDASELELRISRMSYGERRIDAVRLRWRLPGGSTRNAMPTLRWLRPERAESVALGGWPIDERGDLAPSVSLPVGVGMSSREQRQRWGAMAPADRELVLALLAALPAAADRAPEDELTRGITCAVLRHDAAELYKDARRALTALRLRGAARGFLRRGGPSVYDIDPPLKKQDRF